MHILLVRFSSMGDVVLQTATINWLRALLGPELKISFVTSIEFVPLIDRHPQLFKVISYDRKNKQSWKDFIQKIKSIHRQDSIDLILDLHGTLRSWRLKCSLWFIPSITVDKRRWERFLLTKIKSIALKKLFSLKFFGLKPQVERILEDFAGIFSDSKPIRRTIEFRSGPHQEMTSLEPEQKYNTTFAKPYVVIAPSASFDAKRWPVSSFVEVAKSLIDKTELDVVILAGPGDDFCEAFNSLASTRLHNLQGKTNLKESMSILSGSKICVGNDSGMNHIAESFGVPCVTIFGPTDPLFGFSPHGLRSVYLSKELSCKPCSTTGKKPCYRDRHYCMELITTDEVLAITMKMLGEL